MTTIRWLLPVLALTACSEGGGSPESDVLIAAEHHVFGLRSSVTFSGFPVSSVDVETRTGMLTLAQEATYEIDWSTGGTASGSYTIANDGGLTVINPGNATEPTTAFLGGYGLVSNNTNGPQADYVFTDRVTTNNSPRIGMFFGTRATQGQVELEGDWHLMSLHVILDQALVSSPDNVARGAYGHVNIAAGAPGEARAITDLGDGFQGAINQGTTSMSFGGQVRNLETNANAGDGALLLTVEYTPILAGGTPGVNDVRIIDGAAGTEDIIIGVDENSGGGEGEAGLITMIHKFDAQTSPADPALVEGTFIVGGHTFFLEPTASGSDTFVGTVSLGPNGAFQLDAVGNLVDFSYSGTYTLADDGGLTIDIPGTSETWFAAIDRNYNTFAFLDYFQEFRQNAGPELNFGFGVRKY